MKRVLFLLALLGWAWSAHAQTAMFVASDTVTKGTWGTYGFDGYSIAQEPAKLPAYVSITGNSPYLYTWNGGTTDVRALTYGTSRIATCWFGSGWDTNISILDGGTHQLALYFVDWDSTARGQTVQILNTSTRVVLDTRPVTGFNGGIYLVYNVSGNVTVRILQTAGANAVLSGIFFSPLPAPAAPPLSLLTTSIPKVTVGVPYSFTFTASGGTAPYTWTLTQGTLPPGLTLSPAGVLSGTATGGIGTFQVTISVTDSAHETISMTIGRA